MKDMRTKQQMLDAMLHCYKGMGATIHMPYKPEDAVREAEYILRHTAVFITATQVADLDNHFDLV